MIFMFWVLSDRWLTKFLDQRLQSPSSHFDISWLKMLEVRAPPFFRLPIFRNLLQINGPQPSMIQRSRSYRDFAFREVGGLLTFDFSSSRVSKMLISLHVSSRTIQIAALLTLGATKNFHSIQSHFFPSLTTPNTHRSPRIIPSINTDPLCI